MPGTDPVREQALAEITGPGGPFEVVDDDVLSSRLGVFKHRHPHLRALLEDSARRGNDPYFTLDGRTLTYADNLRLAAAVAEGLRRRGVRKGDRVAVFAANRPEYAPLFWGAVSMGAIVTAYNGWWTPAEVSLATELTTPSLIVGDAKRLARVADRDLGAPVVDFDADFGALSAADAALPLVAIDEDDPAVILFTSGTTGRSKGAVASHRSLIGFVQVTAATGALRARIAELRGAPPATTPTSPAITLLTSPMFHVSGLYGGILLGLANGMRFVLRDGRFDPEDVLRIIERERITAWAPVGGLGVRVIEHPRFADYDTSSLRSLSFGGGPTSPATRKFVKHNFPSVGLNMANGYGSSETVASVSSNSGADYEARPDSVGRPNVTCEIAIWGSDDQPVPDGVEGEIHARSAYNMLGYWNDPDATAKTLKRDRWLATGDIGRIDNGLLVLNSRARDMIIRGGENIYPIEVENRLDEHPSVIESAVVGVDHHSLGQQVKAFVVVDGDRRLTADDLAAWAAETLAPYKVPTVWHVSSDRLPRNASGKVLKTVLVGDALAPSEE